MVRWWRKKGPHGGNMVSPVGIGVPRFELGTSPTRTERATRLRHTPSAANRLAEVQLVDDHRAGVLDIVQTRGLRDRARRRRNDALLEPESSRSGRDRLARDFGAELGSPEDVDEVDRALDLGERADALHAE